ncbi:DoxX family protein [Pedosphaera parvula]|uniref:DoxX family protein n=1 Tax=Pedosphaera parvula (strain Ellin514) TaxID=320771 RepID=B9XJV9_PEDPL|nr:DoxX family protein [Pedosphaera parvula]EEF59782.1 DoxX family protein [Pedosphaera parvula Ellin514]
MAKRSSEANHWIKTHGDVILDLIRIYLGVGLILKALYFMTHMDYLLRLTAGEGSMWFAPTILAHYIVVAHLVGGVCLTLGLFTRVAALIQIPVLFAAIFYVHMPNVIASVEARQNAEFAALVLFLLVLFSFYGSGRWSLDYYMSRKSNPDLYRTEIGESEVSNVT